LKRKSIYINILSYATLENISFNLVPLMFSVDLRKTLERNIILLNSNPDSLQIVKLLSHLTFQQHKSLNFQQTIKLSHAMHLAGEGFSSIVKGTGNETNVIFITEKKVYRYAFCS